MGAPPPPSRHGPRLVLPLALAQAPVLAPLVHHLRPAPPLALPPLPQEPPQLLPQAQVQVPLVQVQVPLPLLLLLLLAPLPPPLVRPRPLLLVLLAPLPPLLVVPLPPAPQATPQPRAPPPLPLLPEPPQGQAPSQQARHPQAPPRLLQAPPPPRQAAPRPLDEGARHLPWRPGAGADGNPWRHAAHGCGR